LRIPIIIAGIIIYITNEVYNFNLSNANSGGIMVLLFQMIQEKESLMRFWLYIEFILFESLFETDNIAVL